MYGDFPNLIKEIDLSSKVYSMLNTEKSITMLNFNWSYILEIVNVIRPEKKK